MRAFGLLVLFPATALAFEAVDQIPYPSLGGFPEAYAPAPVYPTRLWAEVGTMYDSNPFRLNDSVNTQAALGHSGKDDGIVRNQLKVRAAVRNAAAFLQVQKEFGSFDAYIWRFVGGNPIQNRWREMAHVPSRTPESDAMSKDLLKRDFKFVGSTICYAFMQATGMVNDHLTDCFRHKQISTT